MPGRGNNTVREAMNAAFLYHAMKAGTFEFGGRGHARAHSFAECAQLARQRVEGPLGIERSGHRAHHVGARVVAKVVGAQRLPVERSELLQRPRDGLPQGVVGEQQVSNEVVGADALAVVVEPFQDFLADDPALGVDARERRGHEH